jgi:hypothetical protein
VDRQTACDPNSRAGFARLDRKLWQKLVELLHEPNGPLQSTEFVWSHGVRVKVHNIVPDHTHFLEKVSECPTINFQIEFCPALRMLEESLFGDN